MPLRIDSGALLDFGLLRASAATRWGMMAQMSEVLRVVEIQKGSRDKYEWSEERQMMLLDRFLSSSVVFPPTTGSSRRRPGRMVIRSTC